MRFMNATVDPYLTLWKGEMEITAQFMAALMRLHSDWEHISCWMMLTVSLVHVKPCAKWEISLFGDFDN